MGSYLSDLAPLRTAQRIERDRRRARRRVLYLAIGVILLGLALFRGYGPYYVNLSPGTDSGGPVSIQTNHTQYRDSEAARVTVTNRLHVPIYTVYFPNPACNIYLVAQFFNVATGQWQPVDHAGSCSSTPPLRCIGARSKNQPTPTIPTNTVLQINPDSAYVETWRQYYNFDYVWGNLGGQETFRVLFVYTTDLQTIQTITAMTNQPRSYFPLGFPDVNNVQVATSAPLQITHDGTRPRSPCEEVSLSAPREMSR